MQSIIRKNDSNGINPETMNQAENQNVETAFVRLPLHNQFYQYMLSTRLGHLKLTKHFFADCDICYGFNFIDDVYSRIKTVIFLNCKFNKYNEVVNYDGANPQIHIETIDDSCRTFTAAEKAAGRSVTELTIKVLCEQLKPINIPEAEKTELINGFIQRRNTPKEEVLTALCASGFDCSDFVLKKGITNDQVTTAMINQNIANETAIITLVKSKLDTTAFAQNKGLSNDQIIIILAQNEVDVSDFAHMKGITQDQVTLTMKNNGLSNDQILITLVKSKYDTAAFIQENNITDEEVIILLAKNSVGYIDYAQKKGISNDQVLIALAQNNIDVQDFAQKKRIANDNVLITLAKNNLDCSDFAQKKGITNDNVISILMRQDVDISAFVQKTGITNDQITNALIDSEFCTLESALIALVKSKQDICTFVENYGLSNDQTLILLGKQNLDCVGFAQKKGISDDQVILILARNNINVSDFAQKKKLSIEQVLVTLMNNNFDYQSFVQSNNISNTQVISAASKCNKSLQEKQAILSKYTELQLEQKEINGALIKCEFELTIERVIKFLNNKQNQIILELAFKDTLLESKPNKKDSAANEIKELKQTNQELQKQLVEIQMDYEQQIAEIKTGYIAELIKCKNELKVQKNEYLQDLQKEYEKEYKVEIELKNTIEGKSLNQNILVELQNNKIISDQEIDIYYTIANQLQMECEQLKQQLIEEKQFYDKKQELTLQLLATTTRNTELQKQLTEEKTQRLQFFSQLQQKQSEIIKSLECNIKDQAARIVHLENENQSLQNTLITLKEQIEKLNVQEYQKHIDLQNKQLEDKNNYISKLKEEMESINVNQLQDKQIEMVLTLLKTLDVSK
ncbi:Hypothetical_protein [Hexamita inflata]|uniref:Hypothetical_protein n=1 Tax=Hexamita inflata TaxID=28002 RepID=A0AA86PD52_9EUKA|nr:Hypothetical protein HINF_LOCUS24351 [Hexamita inflata]CAI9952493.1 Hypothetical protein HINF_LOCUS40138 [Hexamita inflata]